MIKKNKNNSNYNDYFYRFKMEKVNELSITSSKVDNFSNWYRQLVTKCKLIKYYDVSGCYVLLPSSYSMWDLNMT